MHEQNKDLHEEIRRCIGAKDTQDLGAAVLLVSAVTAPLECMSLHVRGRENRRRSAGLSLHDEGGGPERAPRADGTP